MKHFLTVTVSALCLALPHAAEAAGKGKAGKGGKGAAAAEMPPRRVMKLYDTNGNGTIDTGAESEALRTAFEARKNLKHFDTNHDGKLDDAEIAAIKARHGKGGGKGKNKAKPEASA
jgi:Ca2+-binding EF-hand superfamily protein